MKVLIVTSWSDAGHELYGRDFLKSMEGNLPADCKVLVVSDEMLESYPPFREFVERHKDRKMDPGAPGYDYRFDLLRFAHKVFALRLASELSWVDEFDWLCWIDGDVTAKVPVPESLFPSIFLPGHHGFLLSRAQTAPHPECGFMGFNLKDKGREFIRDYSQMYIDDSVLKCDELHDSHVFMCAVVASLKNEMKWVDGCPHGVGPHGLDAFEGSVIGTFFHHRKGNRKLYQPARMDGDWIISKLIEGHEPTTIWMHPNGELPPIGATRVVLRLEGVPMAEIKEGVDCLVASGFGLDKLIFDGFYSQDENGQHIDDTRFGVNNVIRDLVVFDSVERVEIDGKPKGYRHVAVHAPSWKGRVPPELPIFQHRILRPMSKTEKEAVTGSAYQTNMVVQTQNCADTETIHGNIKGNLGLIKEWVRNVAPHRDRVVIVSGGPSLLLPETLLAIRSEVMLGARVVCVKHSHDKLIAAGIIPWGCVLLDPRPHDGFSTHGEEREKLITPDKRVIYFVASMVHPSVTKRLLDAGVRVVGWHAAVGAEEAKVLPPEHAMMLMGGGSSSAGRAMILMWQFLAFTSLGLYAFDSCHLGKVDTNARHQDGTPKYIEVKLDSGGRSKTFITDRDILCQAQDFTRILKEHPWIQWDAHGPGMVAFLYETTKGSFPTLREKYG